MAPHKMEEAQICWRSVRRRGTEVADDNRNIAVASMSPLVSEDGVRVLDAVQHHAPHALLQTRSDGIGASWCSAYPGPSQTLRSALVGAGFKHAPTRRRSSVRSRICNASRPQPTCG